MKKYQNGKMPVFVIGSARSGTSILARLIRDYLGVNFGTESQFIIRFYRRLGRYGDLRSDRNLRRLLADIGKERCFKRWKKFGYQIDLERIFQRIVKKNFSGVLEAIFIDLAVHNQMDRWGDKTPEYIYGLDVLKELFPHAQFVHILRDGRDVAISTFKTHFGAKNIGMAAMEWHRQMHCVEQFKSVVSSRQFHEIKYETFLERPIPVFLDLMEFLGVPDPDGSIRRNIETRLPNELYRGNFYKWKSQLTEKQQVIFEKINYRFLKENGYPTVTDGTQEAGFLEKLLWTINHRSKQFKRIDTWKDNIYKIRLRLRQLINIFYRVICFILQLILPAGNV